MIALSFGFILIYMHYALQTTVPTLGSQDPHQHHLNSNAPLPPGAKGKDQALLMRQKMHLGLGVLDVQSHHGVNSVGSVSDGTNHAYNSVNNSVSGSLR